MHQVLFFLPFHANFLDPRGVPVYGFGAMLFLTFVVTAMVWGPSRGLRVGVPDGRMVDLAIVLFLGGIAGARVVYMLQYREQFGPSFWDYVLQFFQFWKGGIVNFAVRHVKQLVPEFRLPVGQATSNGLPSATPQSARLETEAARSNDI